MTVSYSILWIHHNSYRIFGISGNFSCFKFFTLFGYGGTCLESQEKVRRYPELKVSLATQWAQGQAELHGETLSQNKQKVVYYNEQCFSKKIEYLSCFLSVDTNKISKVNAELKFMTFIKVKIIFSLFQRGYMD